MKFLFSYKLLYFYLFIFVFISIKFLSCSNCSKVEQDVIISEDIVDTVLSDTDIITNIIAEYHKGFEEKNSLNIISLYSDPYDYSLFEQDYFDVLFNTLNNISFEFNDKKVTFISDTVAEYSITGEMNLEFVTGLQKRDYNTTFVLKKTEDNDWRIFQRF